MSARRIQGAGSLQGQVTLQAREVSLALSADSVALSANGIEFRSASPFARWTEVNLTLTSAQNDGRVNCTGVVVASTGNKHTGYHVSVLFTSLTRQAQLRLNQLASAQSF